MAIAGAGRSNFEVSMWAAASAAVVLCAAALAFVSQNFSYETEVIDMPVLAITATFVSAGLVFAFALPKFVRRASALSARQSRIIFALMLGAGLVARLILFASTPILEDDFQRYLWDGAVSASGSSPYAYSPRQVITGAASPALRDLAVDAGPILKRINHGDLTTIYPSVAQAGFALAHYIAPWSLNGWRALLLVFDGAVLAAILILLKQMALPPLWAALYWWNPLVLKEAFNSAHMDALVMAPVMFALVFAARRRPALAAFSLTIAAGAKVWPLLLLPLVLRPLLADRRRLAMTLGLMAATLAAFAWPILAGGMTEQSGFRAYASTWTANSALFPMLEQSARGLLRVMGSDVSYAAFIVKAVLAAGLGALALALAMKESTTPAELLARASILIAALILVAPAQYPWYALWLAPLLVFWPSRAFLLMMATLPVYYATFHFAARETLAIAGPILAALVWVPVYLALARETWTAPRSLAHEGHHL